MCKGLPLRHKPCPASLSRAIKVGCSQVAIQTAHMRLSLHLSAVVVLLDAAVVMGETTAETRTHRSPITANAMLQSSGNKNRYAVSVTSRGLTDSCNTSRHDIKTIRCSGPLGVAQAYTETKTDIYGSNTTMLGFTIV